MNINILKQIIDNENLIKYLFKYLELLNYIYQF